MKIVWMLGGLANQMLQYDFYRALKEKFKDVKIDISGFEDYQLHNGYELGSVFRLTPEIATQSEIDSLADKKGDVLSRIRRRFFYKKKTHFYEKDLKYYPEIFQDDGDQYYEGYWLSIQYFEPIKHIIKSEFSFPKLQDSKNLELLDEIKQTNSISIHVRRGDYVNHPLHGEICNIAYYKQAIKLIKDNVREPKFYIFSNDMEWCIENLDIPDPNFVSWNKGNQSFIDMQLMSLCKHNIIANSGFSWWAAWLNDNPNKIVVSPQKWFNNEIINNNINLLQSSWKQLSIHDE